MAVAFSWSASTLHDHPFQGTSSAELRVVNVRSPDPLFMPFPIGDDLAPFVLRTSVELGDPLVHPIGIGMSPPPGCP